MKIFLQICGMVITALAFVFGLLGSLAIATGDKFTRDFVTPNVVLENDLALTWNLGLLVISFLYFLWLINLPALLRRKHVCPSCNKNKTANRNANVPAVCDDCLIKKDDAEKLAKSDVVLVSCPVDGTHMERKFLRYGIIVNHCPKCDGSWLYKKQVTELKEGASDSRQSSKIAGMSMGFFFGMMIGMQLGRH